MTKAELIEALEELEILSDFSTDIDDDGQIRILTGLMEDDDGDLIPIIPEIDEDLEFL